MAFSYFVFSSASLWDPEGRNKPKRELEGNKGDLIKVEKDSHFLVIGQIFSFCPKKFSF